MGNLSLRKYRPGVNNGYAITALFSILIWTTFGGDTRVLASEFEMVVPYDSAEPSETYRQNRPQRSADEIPDCADEDEDIPTIIPATCGDIETRAKELFVAVPADDRQTVIKILSTCTREQRQQIADAYSRMYKSDLVGRMEYQYYNIFYPNFKRLTKSLTVPLPRLLVDYIYDAFYWNSIDMLDDVLTPLINNSTTAAMKELFEKTHRGPITEGKTVPIITEASQFHRNIISAAYNGIRSSNNAVDVTAACNDVQKLIGDTNIRGWLTADSNFQVILTTRSFPQLREVGKCFKRSIGKSLQEVLTMIYFNDLHTNFVIHDEIPACISILNYAEDKAAFFAEKLRQTVAQIGTNNQALIFFISWRADIDLGNIKKAYVELENNIYKTTLYADVEDDTSGEYRDLLLAIIGK